MGRDQNLASQKIVTAALIVGLLALTVVSNSLVGRVFPTYISELRFTTPTDALVAAALVLIPLPLFVLARFSFGYIVGLWMYGMVAGFIFLSYSSKLEYDHGYARISAMLCLVSFLLPALLLRFKITLVSIRPRAMNALMIFALFFSAAVIAASMMYGFRLAGIMESLAMREEVTRPRLFSYLSGTVSGAVLPFCFAYFALNRRWALSAVAAGLLLAFFPVLLNKTVLLAPLWLVFILVLYAMFSPKTATALSIIIPILIGAVCYYFAFELGFMAFSYINLRMVATPSIAIDHYSHFFSTHPYTNFCQINLVRLFTECPYNEQLGVILKREYDLGNFNGSFFTTEGIASVGPILAPMATFVCGCIIGIGNVASARLSPALVAVSSGVLVQALTNVPLSTTLLSNGGGAVFLLWMLSPRLLVARHLTVRE